MTTCPDCDREMFGERCPCGYNRIESNVVPFRSTYRPIPQDARTKEQFGVELFEAIKLCGGILQLQEMQGMERVIESGRGDEYKHKETALLRELAAMVPKLTVFEQEQLIGRYGKLFGKRA